MKIELSTFELERILATVIPAAFNLGDESKITCVEFKTYPNNHVVFTIIRKGSRDE